MAAVARRALAVVPQARGLATAAAASSPVDIDWALIRSKMMTEEGRAEADKARDAFHKRLSASRSVGEPSPIDWAGYKAKLGDQLNIDALRADFEKMVAATPAIPYDAAGDLAAHAAKEAAWEGFSAYCTRKVAELQALAAEQADHKLHRWYRRSRLWARFPGLYEEAHHKVRGTWDREVWGNYIAYKARTVPLPWNPSHGDITDKQRAAIYGEYAAATGLSPEALGYKPAESAEEKK